MPLEFQEGALLTFDLGPEVPGIALDPEARSCSLRETSRRRLRSSDSRRLLVALESQGHALKPKPKA